MTRVLERLTDEELSRSCPASDEAGFGVLETTRGRLPLRAMDVRGRIDGLLCGLTLTQSYVNTFGEPLEATYIFPLPDRAAVTGFRMEVGGRVIEGELKERGQARREYTQAIEKGHRAAITEEERPGVFTLRVGNIMPGEEAKVRLTLAGPLPYADGEATFRFPLVVAPRYIPGSPLPGDNVGDGTAGDTDAVPDASRISPPVLLRGFTSPVRLSIQMDVMPSGLPVGAVRSSLHAVEQEESGRIRRITLQPGARLDRDFILRLRIADNALRTALVLQPDSAGATEGTFLLTVVPPLGQSAPMPRDVVFVLDRSGSMGGWKMVAARRALGRMVDTLLDQDRFTVLAFDDSIEIPPDFAGLASATDRQRFRAIEFLAKVDSRGGTEMTQPLRQAVSLLAHRGPGRDRVLVLITDGQVGNEDQILHELGPQLRGIRVFCLGIDQAVNAGFLRRLSDLGGGACELVESEDRLDEVMDAMHRRVGQPVLTSLRLEPAGLRFDPDSLIPGRLPDVFAGCPAQVLGRYSGSPQGGIVLVATEANGKGWQTTIAATPSDSPTMSAVWARGQVRKLEDRYVIERTPELERGIVETSLRFSVLCRFTAYVAVDRSAVVNPGGETQQIVQPVETPAGWEEGQIVAACLASPVPAAAAPVRAKFRKLSAPSALLGGGAGRADESVQGRDMRRSAGGPRSPQIVPPQPEDDFEIELDDFEDDEPKEMSGSVRLEDDGGDFLDEEEEEAAPRVRRESPSRAEKPRKAPKKPKPPTVTSFKKRAGELLALLRSNVGADTTIRRRILAGLTTRLKQFLADLDTAGLTLPGTDRLRELLKAMQGDLLDDAVVLQLWTDLEQVLVGFGKAPRKGREQFWK